MYAAAALIDLSTPVALGSLWGILLTVPLAAILVPRIRNEESVGPDHDRDELGGAAEEVTHVSHRRSESSVFMRALAFVALLPAAAGRRCRRRMRGLLLNQNETPHPGPLPAAAGRGGTIERFYPVSRLRDSSARDDRRSLKLRPVTMPIVVPIIAPATKSENQ